MQLNECLQPKWFVIANSLNDESEITEKKYNRNTNNKPYDLWAMTDGIHQKLIKMNMSYRY